MRLRHCLSIALLLLPAWATAAPSLTITSPNPLPAADGRPRVFLAGSIDNGRASNWQAEVSAALANAGVVLLNPRRADWNPAWQADAEEPEFVRQVRWELQALEQADIVLMYFAPGSQSPVTLLEMGLHARSGKLLVAAPEGFWRKGNVDITADHYGVPRFASLPALVEATRMRLNTLAAQRGDATDTNTPSGSDPAQVY
jgi:hypothetical protein